MYKVQVASHLKFTDEQKEELEAVSDQLSFVYHKDTDADIILGNVRPESLKEYKNLKWIQTAAVGIDNFIRRGILPEGVILTNAVDVHSREVAEHTFAMILSMAKKLYLYRDDQHKHLWADEGMVKQYDEMKVCIVGLGDIGNTLAKLCKALGMYVIGVKRRMIAKPDHVDELYTSEDLDKAISDVDVVVTVMPGNKENENLFTLETFRKMRKDTIMINVGRGNLYTEETLKEVLDNKIIAAVSSDVYLKEPLDPNNELWDKPNLVLTPHVAGGYHLYSAIEKFLDLCKENLRRYLNGEELKNIVTIREE